MKLSTNIKAFTLAESLINLMLISIVISLVYLLITIVGKQLVDFERETNDITNYNLLNTTLLNDIYKAHFFDIKANNLNLISYEDKIKSYRFQNNYIIRKTALKRDTFDIKTIDYNYNLFGPQNNIQLQLKFLLLKDTITSSYLLLQNPVESINKTIFNEVRP